jgi:hypothetical protein
MDPAMTQRDWLTVGIKFLGVYFAVLGITGSIIVATNLVFELVLDFQESGSGGHSVRTGGISFVNVLQPIAYLVCAFAMIKRTAWCLRFVDSGNSNA